MIDMTDTKKKAWANLALFILALIVNVLGATGFINGSSQAEVSDRYHTLITPAGFTFSIWSLIYGLLLFSFIVMIVRHEDSYYKQAIDSLSPLIWVSLAANILWIVSFSYIVIGLSTVFIFIYVISLALILKKLLKLDGSKRWLLPLAFGLNTGWLIIASVVNVAAYLVKMNWDGFGMTYDTWAMIIMLVALLLAIGVLLQVKNAAFTLPIAWAFFGISQELQTFGESQTLVAIALANAVILTLAAAYQWWKNKKAVIPYID